MILTVATEGYGNLLDTSVLNTLLYIRSVLFRGVLACDQKLYYWAGECRKGWKCRDRFRVSVESGYLNSWSGSAGVGWW